MTRISRQVPNQVLDQVLDQVPRTVLRLSGGDTHRFLNDLVTNDLARLSDGLVYAALLSPQGKYLFDFFLISDAADVLLDVAQDRTAALMQRLSMYRLRADVAITESGLAVQCALGEMPKGGFADPRHQALGWRHYCKTPRACDTVDWDALRVAHCVPQSGIELIPDSSYILESGFERLNGVDFHKGCYVGQEVTARMKHKTELRKGLITVNVDGAAPVGTAILAHGKTAGVLYTQSSGKGIAYLRFDRAEGELLAGTARISLIA